MYLIILALVLTVIGLIGTAFVDSFSGVYDCMNVCKWIGIIILIMLIVFVPLSQGFSKMRIAEYSSRKETIEIQRNVSSDLEKIELLDEIIGDNAWLRVGQHNNKSKWFGIFINDGIEKLETIK